MGKYLLPNTKTIFWGKQDKDRAFHARTYKVDSVHVLCQLTSGISNRNIRTLTLLLNRIKQVAWHGFFGFYKNDSSLRNEVKQTGQVKENRTVKTTGFSRERY